MDIKKKVESKAAELTARTLTHVINGLVDSQSCHFV